MQAHTYSNIKEYTQKTRKALQFQKEQEIVQFAQTVKTNTAKDLELMGLAMTGLKLKSTKGGLYGRLLFTLQHHLFPTDGTTQKQILDRFKLPQCKFGVGDNLGIYNTSEYIQGKPLATGVVHKKTEHKLIISIDTKQNGDEIEGQIYGNHLSVCCTINEVTYKRYEKALKDLEATDQSHKSKNIINTLFNYMKYPESLETKELEFVDQTLNEKQKEAVKKCISTGSVHLVHGPPGTGKTKTICQVIVQAAKKGWKVLATAGSNIAVDNIVERVGKKAKICRIGHPSRMIESVYEYCLDNLLYKSSFNKVIKDLKRQLDQKRAKYVKTDNRGQRKDLRDEMKDMRSQIRGVEEAAIKQLLDQSQVICCTNTGAGERMFRYELSKSVFDLVVIDQCAQSVEVSCWIPLLKARKAVLAGDHLQLPPTIKSKQAEKILSYTLFDRAMKQCPISSTLLTTQYRMNKAIMNWSSQQFYEGKLEADTTVSDHTIKQIATSVVNFIPLMFIDTDGCQMGQNINKDSSDVTKSKFNLGQADIVKVICKQLVDQGLKNEHIGVITPYNAQVSLIKNLLDPLQKEKDKIQISTVDGFQGRQKQCIIISMVRSNPIKQVGFLSDFRRMNVAVTRAKRFVCLIGDSSTVQSDPSLKTLVQHFEQHGQHRNAIQFRDDQEVRFGQGWIKHDKKQQKSSQLDKQPQIKTKQSQKTKKNKNKKKKQPQVKDKVIGPPKKLEERPNRPMLKPLQHLKEAEQKYIPQIQIFLTSNQIQHVFQNLSALDRKIIHQIAEQFNLEHQTSADKTQLVIRKSIPLDQKKIASLEQLSKSAKQDLLKFTQLTAQQKKDLSQLAKQLKLVADFDEKTQQLTVTKVINKPPPESTQKAKPKPKPKKKKQQPKDEQQDQQAQIAFLQAMMADEKRCHFSKQQCKVNISHLGMKCRFCDYMFCTKHLLAESHGCGQKAQIHARQKHKIQCEKRTGEYITQKDRAALKDKLQKKIKDSQKGRTQQNKKEKK